jgi:uncharacterized coiled-coil protein SlyX
MWFIRYIVGSFLIINIYGNQSVVLDEQAESFLKPLLVYLEHQKPVVSPSLAECSVALNGTANRLPLELVIKALPEILEQITALKLRCALLFQAGLKSELELLKTTTYYVQKVNDALKEAQKTVNSFEAHEIQALCCKIQSFISTTQEDAAQFERLQNPQLAIEAGIDTYKLMQVITDTKNSVELLASKIDSMAGQIKDMQKVITSIH